MVFHRHHPDAGVGVGDELEVVIEDTNNDPGGPPVAMISGVVTFVKSGDDPHPDVGETVHVKIADVQAECMTAVVMD